MRKPVSLPPALTILVAGSVLMIGMTGCASGPTSATAPTTTPSTSTSSGTSVPTDQASAGADDEHTEGDEEHDVTEHYDGPNVVWSADDEARVKDVAQKAMTMFARPEVPETQWFPELEPLLTAEYSENAKYIDPARVPITTITDGPAISREADNPMTVTASFYTNDGPWDVLLHRTGQDAPWLVSAISPKTT